MDAGSDRVLAAVESIRVVRIVLRRYLDPAALLAQPIGARPSHRAVITDGGHHPQALVNRTATQIARGELDIAVTGGAESWRTRNAYKRSGEKAPSSEQDADARTTQIYGSDAPFEAHVGGESRMSIDPRTPVIVGVGQRTWHDGLLARELVDLLAEAARAAAEDAGSMRLLSVAQAIRLVRSITHRYRDPAALLAERVGASPRHRAVTHDGGHFPQALVKRTASDIAHGLLDIAVIGGAECGRTRLAYKRTGQTPRWTRQPDDAAPTEVYGADTRFFGDTETRIGLITPAAAYAVIETALAIRHGWTGEGHRKQMGELWARFSRVAADNPYAALRTPHDPVDVVTSHAGIRMVNHPYPKLLCANDRVDQAAALILCSAERAQTLGVLKDRWVFPLGGADGSDATALTGRRSICGSVAIRHVGRAAMALAGLSVDEIEFIDLYSCFPAAVQLAATELGLTLDRELTVTGGLTFAGGPYSNYSTYAIATLCTLLRENPDAAGLCTANGGIRTKHAAGIYSARPPGRRIPRAECPERDRAHWSSGGGDRTKRRGNRGRIHRAVLP